MTLLLKKTSEKGYEFKYIESFVEKITHKETQNFVKNLTKLKLLTTMSCFIPQNLLEPIHLPVLTLMSKKL